jgi:acetyl-CoA carboxylase carboxyltransferase component
VVIWQFVVSPAIIPLMTTPFRYNKKQRKSYRGQAKAESKAADKLAAKGVDPQIVAAMRTMADINTRLSRAKRKKKSKTPNKTY